MKGEGGKSGWHGRCGPRCQAGPGGAAHAREKEGGAQSGPVTGLERSRPAAGERERRGGAAGPSGGPSQEGREKVRRGLCWAK